ncbi:MAG: STT3 domain-containing protein [Candidatus Nanoarchaeia archaeon]
MQNIKLEGIIKNLKEKTKFFTNKEKWIYWFSLLPIFALALWIRTRNLPLLKGKYLIELDSYFFFRLSKMLYEQGSIPSIDYMRYVPEYIGTAGGTFFPKTMVFFYKLIHIFFANLSQIEWHIIYPPVITIIAFIVFFLFVKEITNYKTAFIATAFLAVIPAYIQRTGAGFADHEAFAMLWMFASLLLLVLAWKSKSWKSLPLSALSGVFAAMMAGTWGGYIFLVYTILLFFFAYGFIRDKLEKKDAAIIFIWSIFYIIFCFLCDAKNALLGQTSILISFTALFTCFLLLCQAFVKSKKIPKSIISTVGAGLCALLISFVFNNNVITLIKAAVQEGQNRLFFTVAENAQPYLGDWWGAFNLTCVFAFVGAGIIFYKIFESKERGSLEKRIPFFSLLAYLFFIFAFIFSRLSPYATISFFSNTYKYWLIIFIGVLFLIYLFSYYKSDTNIKLEGKEFLLIIAILFLLTLLAARGQIRLLFMVTPVFAFLTAYSISNLFEWVSDKNIKIKIATIGIISMLAIFTFATCAQASELQNKYSSSMVPGQWGAAMDWIRENTPENAVFAHWWDYGYLTITVGQRAAVTDGGNAKGWNHQSGRYFLTGKDENSTLTYLKTHKVTHILISWEEILKYHAFSYIGSDENFDRRSTIGLFALKDQKEVRDGTLLIYTGVWPLDKDYVLDKLILPEGNSAIAGFSIKLVNESLLEPTAYVIAKGNQYALPISCLFVNGKRLEFDGNLSGCLVLIPYFSANGKGASIGGALWLSEKVWDTNFAKLYLYNEKSPYFKLVYQDNTPLAFYNGRIIGPIKIWEVNYPNYITEDPYYLQSSPLG